MKIKVIQIMDEETKEVVHAFFDKDGNVTFDTKECSFESFEKAKKITDSISAFIQ